MTAATVTCTRDQAEQITGRFREAIGRVESAWNVMVATAIDAFANRVWVPLGYSDWDTYCAEEVDTAAVRIPRDLRIEIVGQMSEAGMSSRAIGAAIGVHKDTVRNDLAGGELSPPGVEVVMNTETGEKVFEIEWTDGPGEGLVLDDEPALTQEECEALDAERSDPDLTDAELAREAAEVEAASKPRITGVDGKSYPAPEPKKPQRKPLPDAFWRATYDLGKEVKRIQNLATDDRFNKNADQIKQANLQDLIRARDALQGVIEQLS